MRIDPYLCWKLLRDCRLQALLSDEDPPDRGSDDENCEPECLPFEQDALFAVIIERKWADQALIVESRVNGDTCKLLGLNQAYAPLHTHTVESTKCRPRYQPGLVTGAGLKLLIAALPHLGHASVNLRRWELAQAGEPLLFLDGAGLRESELRPAAAAGVNDLFLLVADHLRHQMQRPLPDQVRQTLPVYPLSDRPLRICIIDDGCNFAAPGLVRNTASGGSLRSVVGEFLVQSGEKDRLQDLDNTKLYVASLEVRGFPIPYVCRGSLLGRRLRTGQFEKEAKAQGPGLAQESWVYQATQNLHPTPHGRHGAAVLDLIANPRLWVGDRPHERRAPSNIHFVQLPAPTVVDTAGSSLSAHALTALHEALFQAKHGEDVLVNLSFGNHSGPHDGSSMIESAIVELLDLYDGSHEADGKRLMVVLPAGNSHLLRCHAQGHACAGRPSVIDWKVLPDDDTDNFIEMWVPRGRIFTISVCSPGGRCHRFEVDWSEIDSGEGIVPLRRHGKIVAALMGFREPPQSKHLGLLLLAVCGNGNLRQPPEVEFFPVVHKGGGSCFRKRRHSSGHESNLDVGPHGIWRIELAPVAEQDTDPLAWHAYVQRGDVAPLRRRSARGVFGRQSYIVDNCESKADPMFTLNGIATASHKRLFVVGAMERADGRLSPYSASGPRVPNGLDASQGSCGDDGRVCGPCWVVPADESRRRRGLLVGGVLGGSRLRTSGTSMAAATFTRHLWEHLCAGRTLESFCGSSPADKPAPTVIPVDAPCHAPDLCRGETHRLLSTRPDGSL